MENNPQSELTVDGINMRTLGVNSPDTQEFGLFAGSRRLRLHLQRIDMGDGDNRGSHVPGQTHERADYHEDGHPEQVQVVAGPFLKERRRRRTSSAQAEGGWRNYGGMKMALMSSDAAAK